MKKTEWSDQDIERLRRWTVKRKPLAEIAAYFGVSTATVTRFRTSEKVKAEPPEGKNRPYGKYLVYEYGRVWNYKRGHWMKEDLDRDGYSIVTLNGKKFKLHRLVLTLFKRPPKKGEVCRHRDGVTSHNYASNLMWGTAIQNNRDKERHGTKLIGEALAAAKLTECKVIKILKHPVYHGSQAHLARKYGVSSTVIASVLNRKTWKHVNVHIS